ncbi:hypothetical protein NA56DRAFT_403669 [Hyaloscypha hepaticicola]|uniref:Uncharacterized protein n=1 Tax=Hyaloscypha hepaticicola TaxID=2082293 RepID=A0A2J6PJ28_9HELO|nr:hypothetical protein NA56DRAFT_403669 [Hyaloscypha hepaticicola]
MPFYVCRNCSFGDDLPYRFCPRCGGALLVPMGSVGFARERTQRPSPGAYRDPAAINQWLQGVQEAPPGRRHGPPPPANFWRRSDAWQYRY